MSALTITHATLQPNSRYARIKGTIQGKPLRIGQRLSHPVYSTQLTVCNVFHDNSSQSLEYLMMITGNTEELHAETYRSYN